MQISEFNIKINLSTATLMANHWYLWIETTPQLWINVSVSTARLMYLYPFKHSLEVHTSRVASVDILTTIILTTTTAHVLQNFAILQLFFGEGEEKKKNKPKWVPGPFRLLLPLLGPDPHKHSRTSPAWTDISILFSRQGRHTDLVETGVYRVTLGNCFPWFCILWSPS